MSIVCIGDSTSSVKGKKNTDVKVSKLCSWGLIDPAAFALVSGGSGHEPDVTFRDQLPLTRNARVITWPTMLCWCRANERWGRDFQLYRQQQPDSSVSPAFVRAYSSFPWRTASARNVLGPPWQLFGWPNAQHHSDAVSLVLPRRSPIQISLVNNCELAQTCCFLLSEAQSADSVIQIVHAPLSGSADSRGGPRRLDCHHLHRPVLVDRYGNSHDSRLRVVHVSTPHRTAWVHVSTKREQEPSNLSQVT